MDDLPPTNVSDAYLAGFFDGEGSISICRKSRRGMYGRFGLNLCVANTFAPPVEALRRRFGGRLYAHAGRGSRKPQLYWYIDGPKAESVLQELYPLLWVKRERAWLALEYRAQCIGPRGAIDGKPQAPMTEEQEALSAGFYFAMRYLNQRGKV